MERPLVSVVCLCFNHARFVREAIVSVLQQTYPNVELILVDDGSTDGSVPILKELAKENPHIVFIPLPVNGGNCKAFNSGYRRSSGKYVIDFSTDDVMKPDRIERQVDFFERQDAHTGVVFTDAEYIDEHGAWVRNHYEYLFQKGLIRHVPSGDVFRDVLTKYFICSPTMMARREVLDALGGYDETLAYEDFDFWVRASRMFVFKSLNEKTTKVRRSAGSMSRGWYQKGDRQLHSTYLVCVKAKGLCRDEGDLEALRWRVAYEFRQSVFSQNRGEAKLFSILLTQLGKKPASHYLVRLAFFLPLPWAWMRGVYHRLRYG